MMQDIVSELARVKGYLDASYAPLIANARQSVLDALNQLGVPLDASSSSESEILNKYQYGWPIAGSTPP